MVLFHWAYVARIISYGNGEGVILVDYRHDTHIKQLLEGILSIHVLGILMFLLLVLCRQARKLKGKKTHIGNIISGEEDLSDGNS